MSLCNDARAIFGNLNFRFNNVCPRSMSEQSIYELEKCVIDDEQFEKQDDFGDLTTCGTTKSRASIQNYFKERERLTSSQTEDSILSRVCKLTENNRIEVNDDGVYVVKRPTVIDRVRNIKNRFLGRNTSFSDKKERIEELSVLSVHVRIYGTTDSKHSFKEKIITENGNIIENTYTRDV